MNKSTITTGVLSAVAGGIVGGAITFVVVNTKLKAHYQAQVDAQVDDVKKHYAELNKDGKMSFLEQAENPSPEVLAAVEKGKELLKTLGYSEDGQEQPHESATTLSIFDQGVDESEIGDEEDGPGEDDENEDDYEVRDGEPFKISEAAYFENEPDYALDTLTYYERDDTLTDENNNPIDRIQETIGTRHLDMFERRNGKTSVYIQNDEHSTLYEVILVEQSYAVTILGMDESEIGLKPAKKRPKKMPKDHD